MLMNSQCMCEAAQLKHQQRLEDARETNEADNLLCLSENAGFFLFSVTPGNTAFSLPEEQFILKFMGQKW